MERRLILAIALALLVLLSWSALTSKFYPVDKQIVTEKSQQPARVMPTQEPGLLGPEPEPPPSSLMTFSPDKLEIVFIEPQAAIKEVIFKDYGSYKFPLQYGFLLGEKNLVFKKEDLSDNQVTFVHSDKDKQIIKRFNFSNSNYGIELEIEVQNLSPAPLSINLPLILGVLNFSGDQAQVRFRDAAIVGKEKTLHLNARKEIVLDEVQFLGLRDRYFCAIIEPESNNYTGFIKKLTPKDSEIGLVTKEFRLSPGQQKREKFYIYLGPQDLRIITSIKPHWSAVVYYGSFDIISHLLLQLLEILYRLVHNWGGAIILLSILIYLLLYPLTLKQMRSMKQMQALQPRIEELRNTYKDNPQKLNKEIMDLYRQNRINPFGGCLPLVLQIPVFFALYQALIRYIALKGANFLWIKDLSEPDRLFLLPVNLPIITNEINILPILMTVGMFMQQKISMSTTASTTSAEQQKLMLILFPLMFGFIFYHMPAGLVLYWFVNSSLMLIYQFRATRTK
jgi:YidC/Oxa1 family membrane protein insertase